MPDGLPRTWVDVATVAAAFAAAAAAIFAALLAIATFRLAAATHKLVQSAQEESKHISEQASATQQLANAAADQLSEFRAETRQAARPLLVWELVDSTVQARFLRDNDSLVYLVLAARLANHGGAAILEPNVQIASTQYSATLMPPGFGLPSMLPQGHEQVVHIRIDSPRRNENVSMVLTLTAEGRGLRFGEQVTARAEFAIATTHSPSLDAEYVVATVRQI